MPMSPLGDCELFEDKHWALPDSSWYPQHQACKMVSTEQNEIKYVRMPVHSTNKLKWVLLIELELGEMSHIWGSYLKFSPLEKQSFFFSISLILWLEKNMVFST